MDRATYKFVIEHSCHLPVDLIELILNFTCKNLDKYIITLYHENSRSCEIVCTYYLRADNIQDVHKFIVTSDLDKLEEYMEKKTMGPPL